MDPLFKKTSVVESSEDAHEAERRCSRSGASRRRSGTERRFAVEKDGLDDPYRLPSFGSVEQTHIIIYIVLLNKLIEINDEVMERNRTGQTTYDRPPSTANKTIDI